MATKKHSKAATARLTGQSWERAYSAVCDINYAASAMSKLARLGTHELGGDSGEAEAYLCGIQNAAKVVCLKCEVLSSLLNAGPGFGTMDEEFRVTEARQ